MLLSIGIFILTLTAIVKAECPDQDGTVFELWSDPATWDNNVIIAIIKTQANLTY